MTEISTSAKDTKEWTPEEWAKIESNTMDPDVFADRLFDQLEASPGLLSKEQVSKIESLIQHDQIRRASFAIAALSGKDLCDGIAKDREFAVTVGGIYSELPAMIKKYQQLTDIFNQLETRLMIALYNREDMDAVISEGKETIFA